MRRWRYIVAAGTIVGVFTSLHGGLYDRFRDTYFPSMKSTYPVLTAVVSSLIISVLGLAVIVLVGILWMRLEERRKRREIDSVREWFNQEMNSLIEGMRTIVRELIIELDHHSKCRRQKKRYNWSRWDRLVDICDLVRGSSGLCNVGCNEEIEEYIECYAELSGVKGQRESIIQGFDRLYRFLSNRAAEDIVDIHRAGVVIEDVRDTHIGQLRRVLVKV